MEYLQITVVPSSNHAELGLVAKRAEILKYLQNDITDKRKMEEELGVSRSTINRSLSELREERIIEPRNHGYELTVFGELALQEYNQFADVYDTLVEAKELLDHLSKDTTISTEVLYDADVQFAEQPAPDRPLKMLQDNIRQADQVDILTPILVQRLIDLFERQINDNILDISLVCSSDLFSYLSDEYPEWIRTVLDNCGIWETERVPEYGLYLIDENKVCLCIYDQNGKLQGTLSNGAQPTVDWAVELVEEYRHRGQMVLHSSL